MLVLNRKPGEKITLTGGIVVTVCYIKCGSVSIGIEAPDSVKIVRDNAKERGGDDAISSGRQRA